METLIVSSSQSNFRFLIWTSNGTTSIRLEKAESPTIQWNFTCLDSRPVFGHRIELMSHNRRILGCMIRDCLRRQVPRVMIFRVLVALVDQPIEWDGTGVSDSWFPELAE